MSILGENEDYKYIKEMFWIQRLYEWGWGYYVFQDENEAKCRAELERLEKAWKPNSHRIIKETSRIWHRVIYSTSKNAPQKIEESQ